MSDWIGHSQHYASTAANVEKKLPENEQHSSSSSASLSIAEMVAQAAQEFVSEQWLPGFVYSEQHGAYYNADTGYFYDPHSSLFFHPSTPQCYYQFNEHSGQYEVVMATQEEEGKEPAATWSKNGFKRRAERLMGEQFVQTAGQEDIDVMELALDLVDRCSFFAGDSGRLGKRTKMGGQEVEEIDGFLIKRVHATNEQNGATMSSSDEEEDEQIARNEAARLEHSRRMAEEEIAREAPCIRLVVQPGQQLHIVTILGARVGFGPGMDVRLDGEEEGEEGGPMLTIRYTSTNGGEEEGTRGYQMEMAENGGKLTTEIHLNGQPIVPGVPYPLNHEAQIQFGRRHTLCCHIHSGLNTCAGCEPGLFMTPAEKQNGKLKKYSKNAERRRQNKALKEQYGLIGGDNPIVEIRSKYVDRAKERRKKVGSVDPSEKMAKVGRVGGGIYAGCSAAPVAGCSADSVQLRSGGDDASSTSSKEAPVAKGIGESNKGFQLLKGMGWKAGQGLGKNNQGIQGPIGTVLKNDRAGLGAAKSDDPDGKGRRQIAIRLNAKEDILERTRQRYAKIGEKEEGKN